MTTLSFSAGLGVARLAHEPSCSAWHRLEGRVAPEVLRAPKTAGDPHNNGEWPDVHDKTVRFLERNAVGKPWGDHLALMAAVLSARRRDPQTVLLVMWALHPRFAAIFEQLNLSSMADWDAEKLVLAYLRGEVLPDDTQSVRTQFWSRYNAATKQLKGWIRSLPEAERVLYQRFVLKDVHPSDVEGLARTGEVKLQQERRRKAETDAVVPRFADIRAEAHFRHNRLTRLRQAYYDAVARLKQSGTGVLPFSFSYDEGGDSEQEESAQERLHFRIWDRRSFVLGHADSYHKVTVRKAQRGADTFGDDRNSLFLEFVRAERLMGDAPPEGFWFAELIQRGVLGRSPLNASPEEIAAREAWHRAWGYGEGRSGRYPAPFASGTAGILSWQAVGGEGAFIAEAQRRTEGVLMPVEPFYAAATFGLLAVDLFTTTGMRMNEAMQARLSEDCFVRLLMPAPPGAKDPTPRTRWAFRLIPKGERMDQPATYFIGDETKRLLVKVVRMLAEHYSLSVGESLPAVPFDQHHGRSHRFGVAPYLFQYGHNHLDSNTITACMRFLLHGMVFRTREGAPVVLKAHLLRHAFATHAVQVEQIPIDIVGEWLKQKSLDVTDYYSKPTESMVGEAADQFLTRTAAHVRVAEAVRRTPQELQKLYEDARGKVGTLSEVIGGHCVSHGFCAAKFACVGCAAKVPDPAKRNQVERHKQWALMQVDFTTQEGLYPEAERMKQLVRDCETELSEMDQIDAYRRDEVRVARVNAAHQK